MAEWRRNYSEKVPRLTTRSLSKAFNHSRPLHTEVVRFFMSRMTGILLYKIIDDDAPGHKGVFPNCFLEQSRCARVPVPVQGGCTGLVQAADRPQTNQVLPLRVHALNNYFASHRSHQNTQARRPVREAIHSGNLMNNLRKKLHKGLTREARDDLPQTLAGQARNLPAERAKTFRAGCTFGEGNYTGVDTRLRNLAREPQARRRIERHKLFVSVLYSTWVVASAGLPRR